MSRGHGVKASGRVLWAAVAVLLAALVVAPSPAGAAPRGIFSVFGGCPAGEKGEGLCIYVQVSGGVLSIGRTTVPIDRTLTVQAGARGTEQPERLNTYDLVAPKDGPMISGSPLEIPGGLGGTEMTVTVEAVPTASNPAVLSLGALVLEKGPALVLPARVHLGNVFLGSSCYLGSGLHPIMLEMMTGTTSPPPPNRPISGHIGSIHIEEENGLEATALGGSVLVDNAFTVPVAEGCGGPQLSSVVDPILDSILGLPSKAGHNTAILDAGTLDLASASDVIESER
jgi:hypothetical protein